MTRVLLVAALLAQAACTTLHVGDLARPIELTDLSGAKVTGADLRGHVTIIDFYATWCGPCQRLRPILENIARQTPQLELIVVDVGETRGWATAAFDRKKLPSNVRVV